ncbi:hypothetical protein F8M41_018170 [Gigaspora margarita]|uniref:Uncharacterized protein n=1 Tax=Gigaspora margarita TaxID=4874 RepID=A0A8H4ELM2_GIGMA|nr:hypothetical protein F8M41_018170 [Gigaspora margarita]
MFMGDMPELMEIILNNLNNEFYSLYSCSLSGATLHKLELNFFDYEINPEIFYSLGRNEQFFTRLQDLSLGLISDLNIENITVLLKILAKNATKINSLKLDEFYSDSEPELFHALICIIKSQEQLRQFSLAGGEEYHKEFHSIISALESQKNSLQEVLITCCTCSTEFKVLTNCKNLEILRIEYCNNLKILEASLNTLEVTNISIDASSIVQILQKSGTVLERLSLVSKFRRIQEEPLLLETLKPFCPNITYLSIGGLGFFTQFLEFIKNLQKLQFLTLHGFEILYEPEMASFITII